MNLSRLDDTACAHVNLNSLVNTSKLPCLSFVLVYRQSVESGDQFDKLLHQIGRIPEKNVKNLTHLGASSSQIRRRPILRYEAWSVVREWSVVRAVLGKKANKVDKGRPLASYKEDQTAKEENMKGLLKYLFYKISSHTSTYF